MRFFVHYDEGPQPFCKKFDTRSLPDDATLNDVVLLFLHAAVAKHGPGHPLGHPLEVLRDTRASSLMGILAVCDADECYLDLMAPVDAEEGADLTVSLPAREKAHVQVA